MAAGSDVAVEEIEFFAGDTGREVTVYAIWIAASYTVEYRHNQGGGSVPVDLGLYNVADSSLVDVLFAPAPVRAGFTFLGWARAADADEAEFALGELESFELSGNEPPVIVLYAVWQVNSYAVTYLANVPALSPAPSGTMTPDTAVYGSGFELAANAFSAAGYQFIGWNTAADGGGDSYANESGIGRRFLIQPLVKWFLQRLIAARSRYAFSCSAEVNAGAARKKARKTSYAMSTASCVFPT